jgi:hypothetical protein
MEVKTHLPGELQKGNWSPNGRNGPFRALFVDVWASFWRPAKTVKMGSGPQRPQNRIFWLGAGTRAYTRTRTRMQTRHT